jgi:PKD repeat protein
MKRISIFAAFIVTIALSSCDKNEMRMCFESSDKAAKVNQRVTFNASCSVGMEEYHWNFGDGKDTVTRTQSVEHTFDYAGYYTVALHNTNARISNDCPPNGNGNAASTSIEITE